MEQKSISLTPGCTVMNLNSKLLLETIETKNKNRVLLFSTVEIFFNIKAKKNKNHQHCSTSNIE